MKQRREQTEEAARRSRIRLVILVAIALAATIALLYVFFQAFGLQRDGAYCVDGYLRAETVDPHGNRKTFDDNFIGPQKKGSRVILHLKKHDRRFRGTAALCLEIYNAEIRVTEGGAWLYSQTFTEAQQLRQIGHLFYMVPLPQDYNDGSLDIQLTMTSENTDSAIRNVWICPATNARDFVVRGREFELVIFLVVLAVSLFLLLFCVMESVRMRKAHRGLFMSAFCFVLSCWYLGFRGLFYVIAGNAEFCANVEYVAIYLAAAPLAAYLAMQFSRRAFRIAAKVICGIFLGFFCVVTVLNYSPVPVTYSTCLQALHVMIVAAMAVFVVGIFAEGKRATLSGQILRIGISIGIIGGLSEIFRIFINQIYGSKYHFLSNTIAPFAILSFVSTLLISFGAQVADDYHAKIEHQELQRLAYIDTLTGIPNRARCYRELERLAEEKKAYSMVFVDVNELKKANDVYGHEVGDRLISRVAVSLGKAVGDDGFFGRWGGDEFIACFEGSSAEARHMIDQFRKYLAEANARKEFPFEISAAVGVADSTPEHPIDPVQAINRADEAMYYNKKKMKKERRDR